MRQFGDYKIKFINVYTIFQKSLKLKFNLKQQVPNIRCKDRPKSTQEILLWSKETCGSIFYIKREIYLVTTIIELLKLSAIAFKYFV